jgi:hypothetical protein
LDTRLITTTEINIHYPKQFAKFGDISEAKEGKPKIQRESISTRYKTAEEHAMKDHGYKPEDLMTPELREKIRSHIKRS